MSAAADERRARGQATRQRLVEATLTVIERGGIPALTHRAVAEQAGVSLTSASYHFQGLDELLDAALDHANDVLISELAAHEGPVTAEALAELILHDFWDRRELWLASYEFYLAAARAPEHDGKALRWLDALIEQFAPTLEGAERDAWRALVEGLCLHTLLDPRLADPATFALALRAALPAVK